MDFFLLRQKQKQKQNGDEVGLLVFVCLSGAQNETEKPTRQLRLIDWTSGLGLWWQIKALGIAQKTNLPEALVFDLVAEARDSKRKYCGQFLKVQLSAAATLQLMQRFKLLHAEMQPSLFKVLFRSPIRVSTLTISRKIKSACSALVELGDFLLIF